MAGAVTPKTDPHAGLDDHVLPSRRPLWTHDRGGHWKRVVGRVGPSAWVVNLRAGTGLGLAAHPPARVDDRPVGRRHRAVVRGPAHPVADRSRERRDLPRRDDRRRLGVLGDRAADQPAPAELAAHPAGGDPGGDRDRRLLLLRHRADPARPSARRAARRRPGAGRELPVGPRGHGPDVCWAGSLFVCGPTTARSAGSHSVLLLLPLGPCCRGSTSAPTTSPTR